MLVCKRCENKRFIKNGVVSGKQRYEGKECKYNFREGDGRTNGKIAAKKALCILFYVMAKGSFRMLGRILHTDHTLVYRWIRKFGESLPEASFRTFDSKDESRIEVRKDGRLFPTNLARRDHYKPIPKTANENNAYI